MYGPEGIYVNSACDWGYSIPLAIPQFIFEMRRRQHAEDIIHQVVFDNPNLFFSQSPKFRLNRTPARPAARMPELDNVD